MLRENRNRRRLQIRAKHLGSCTHGTQQNVTMRRSIDRIVNLYFYQYFDWNCH